jgi:hypothetical protein
LYTQATAEPRGAATICEGNGALVMRSIVKVGAAMVPSAALDSQHPEIIASKLFIA